MLTKISILLFALCWIGKNPGSNAPEEPCASYYSKELKKNVYTRVEIEPEFSGGAAGYQRFLNKNLRYPLEMIDTTEMITPPYPIMKFIIDTDGQIKNIRINNKTRIEDMDPMEKETLRLVKLMPAWTPGYCQGKAVAAEHKRPLAICIRLETE